MSVDGVMKLSPPYFKKGDGFLTIGCRYTLLEGSGDLWIKVDDSFEEYVDVESVDPFFLPALLIAMEKGVTLVVEGKLSDVLYYNGSLYLQELLVRQCESFNKISVVCNSLVSDAPYQASGVGAGFSCGIDSFASIYDHFYNQSIDTLKLTHLFQINHNQNHRETAWGSKLERYKEAADYLNLPLVLVATNFYSKLTVPYQAVYTILNCSSILLFRRLIRIYYYASSYEWNNVFIGKSKDVAFADPIVMPLISTSSTRFFSSGAELTRVEKTKNVMGLDVVKKYLEVCPKFPKGKINCSLCYKCERTMMALDAFGVLNEYYHIFNLARWKRRRPGYVNEVRQNVTNPFLLELKLLGENTGYFRRLDAAKKRREQGIISK